MPTWSEKEMSELRQNILSGLKSGLDILEVIDCLKASDEMILEALVELTQREEIDVIVT
jgi:hypothetical protein